MSEKIEKIKSVEHETLSTAIDSSKRVWLSKIAIKLISSVLRLYGSFAALYGHDQPCKDQFTLCQVDISLLLLTIASRFPNAL